MLRFSIFLLLCTFLGCVSCEKGADRGKVKHGSTPSISTSQGPPLEIEADPKTLQDQVDINKTVDEVERILGKYPELPRLDRSEILSILQNITEEDNEKLKDELAGVLEEEQQKMQANSSQIRKTNVTTGTAPRSVMVVLPFQADDEKESLEELYTRSPIVMLEEQKETIITSTKRPSSSQPAITEPPYTIIEKEDHKFNPPLKIIGYRYHTTAEPYHSNSQSSTSYSNLQDPAEVTMAFRTQEVTAGYTWHHANESEIIEKPGTVLDDDPPYKSQPVKSSGKFHVPDNLDNFSLEDVMLENPKETRPSGNFVPTEEKTTPKIYITSAEEKSTPKIYITSAEDFEFEKMTTTTTPMMFVTNRDYVPKKSTTVEPTKKKYKEKATAKPVKPNKSDVLKSVINNLPPHMKDMLVNIGIDGELPLENSAEIMPKIPKNGMSPDIDPTSFQQFKPLPTKKQRVVNSDMQSFLASFGLLENGGRQQKASVEQTTKFNDKYLESAPEINPDFLTDSMKKTLFNLGLYNQSLGSNTKNHIFNPSNHSSAQNDEEVRKLNSLLSTIKKLASLNDSEPVTPEFQRQILQQVKELDNITISYKSSALINEEIHRIMDRNKGKFKIPIIMKESTASNTLKSGLDPQFFEDIQLKNEVKRQENSSATTTTEVDTSSSTTEADASTSTSTTTTTTEPSNSPELENSFGGGGVAPAGSDPSASLPTPRPNGLYFLLDWNTFFQVGTEDDRRRVNIRFQPKIGDGRNFLPVTIP